MLTRTILALLLLFPAAATAQDLDTALSAMVRISGTRGGTQVRGTGFVIGMDREKATIVTASHVVQGVQQLEVTFAVNPTESFSAGGRGVLGMDADNPNGLAVFQIRGALPAGVTPLSFEAESRPRQGDELFLVGFPEMALSPLTSRRVLSGWRGMLLLIDQGIGEGFSGGPVLQRGKVVGVVTETDSQTTYAINAVVAREALVGWGVKLGGQSSIPVGEKQSEGGSPEFSEEQMEAIMKARTPGEMHKRITRLAGDWTFANTMWITPGKPPNESSGTMHAEVILDGRFVQSVWKGRIMGLPFEGRGIEGYDNVTKQYVSSWVDNMGTGIMYSVGTCEDNGRRCTIIGTSPDAATGGTFTTKAVVTWIDDDTVKNESYGKDPSGKEFKMMEIILKRRQG